MEKKLYFFLHILFSFVIPIVIVADQYDVIKHRSEYGLAGGAIIIAYLTYRFIGRMYRRFMDGLSKGYLKTSIEEFVRLAPYAIIWIILIFAQIQMDKFVFIIKWTFVSNIIAFIFLMLYTGRVIKDERQNA